MTEGPQVAIAALVWGLLGIGVGYSLHWLEYQGFPAFWRWIRRKVKP